MYIPEPAVQCIDAVEKAGFCGREDLQKGILRAAGDPEERFREDPLRILRGVRFAVRYHLAVEPETEKAMFSLTPLLEHLDREKVFAELCGLLPHVSAEDLQRFQPVLTAVIPELAPTVGFDQRSPHHAYDLYTHICKVTAAVPPDVKVRWAALLHDSGKVPTFTQDSTGRGHFYGHAQAGAEIADGVLRRLKAPNALREQVVVLIQRHMTPLEPDRKVLRRWVSRLGLPTVEDLLALQQADMASKGTDEDGEAAVFGEIRAVLRTIQEEEAYIENGKEK